MNILITISTLKAGGAEKVASLLSNEWAGEGKTVTIATFENSCQKPFFQLSSRIKVVGLDIYGVNIGFCNKIITFFKKIFKIRNIIKKTDPDIVISFIDQTNVLTLIASLFTKYPVIVTEHVSLSKYSPGRMWEYLRKLFYFCSADSIVAVSNGVRNSLSDKLKDKCIVIPNPVKINTKTARITADRENKLIVAMGRLTEQKGFDLLIKAFGTVKNDIPGWKLDIWGEGPMKSELEDLITGLSLNDSVRLCGLTDDTDTVFSSAGLFILSSRFEGFGNVIIEAMACGTPVISTDCPEGPAEIIKNRETGILVKSEDINDLAINIKALIADPQLRKMISQNALIAAKDYDIKQISARWNDHFSELTGETSI